MIYLSCGILYALIKLVSTEQREINSIKNYGGWSSTSELSKFLVFCLLAKFLIVTCNCVLNVNTNL